MVVLVLGDCFSCWIVCGGNGSVIVVVGGGAGWRYGSSDCRGLCWQWIGCGGGSFVGCGVGGGAVVVPATVVVVAATMVVVMVMIHYFMYMTNYLITCDQLFNWDLKIR